MMAVKYAAFALCATGVNLFCQFLVFFSCENLFEVPDRLTHFVIYLAIFVGTLVGLMTKYVLDKRYIFMHAHVRHKSVFTFLAYSTTGVFTTGIFWATEMIFDYLFVVSWAKYIGAALGLTVGYICKYHLDKKYVFLSAEK